MYVYLYYSPLPSEPPDFGNARHGYAHLKEILTRPQGFYDFASGFVDILRQYNEIGLLVTVVKSEPLAQPFIWSCIRLLNDDDYKGVTPQIRDALASIRAETLFEGITM
jgi:hypothetical protein